MALHRTLGIAVATAIVVAMSSATNAGLVAKEAGPNLVKDPGFEDTASLGASPWTASGFIFEGFDYMVDLSAGDAHSGTHSFAGGGIGAPGFISQTLATRVGANYNIHLWLANLSGFSSDTEIQVMWGSNLVYSATDIAGFSYKEIVIDPIATSTSTTLAIGLRDDSFFLNIDDISVRQIPEPASLALLLGGLAATAMSRRRRPS